MPHCFRARNRQHLSFSGAPHSPQNLVPLAFSKLQAGQRMDGFRELLARIDLRVAGIQGTGAPATWGKRTQGLKSYITVGNLYRLHSRSSKARRSPRRACE
jgi:hypothetical protein